MEKKDYKISEEIKNTEILNDVLLKYKRLKSKSCSFEKEMDHLKPAMYS